MDDEQVGAGEAGSARPRTSRWKIVGAQGAGAASTARSRKACAPAADVHVQGPGGQDLSIEHRPPPGSPPLTIRAVREIARHRFDRCPICLAPEPSTREHVPPASIGGTAMTWVCQRCNNDLGSRIEVDLLDWRDDALRRPRISGESVQGYRKFDRILRRTTADGKFVLVIEGPGSPDISAMLASGTFALDIIAPAPAKYQLAALKHAYLAACLNRQEIPDTASARQIRSDLVAARDAPPGSAFPVSDYAASVSLMRSYGQHAGPPLALGMVDGAARTDGRAEMCILLGASLCVSWPMPDVAPAR